MPLNTSGHVVVIDVRVGPGAKTAGAAMTQVGKSTKQAGIQAKQAQREFASLAGAFTALFAVGMVRRGFEALIRPAVAFDLALTRLKGVTKASEEDLDKFRAKAIEVAKITPFGPQEMVETLTELRRATGNTEAALASLNATATLTLATFGKMGLQGATRMVAESIKTFGLKTHEVADAMDRLAAVSLATGTGIENFERTISRLGTVATVTGQSFDEMIMLATLAGRGVTEPTRNIRLLSSALKMLQQDKARTIIEDQLGVQIIDPISGAMRRASTIFTEMSERMMSDPVKVRAAMVAAFGQRGGESVGAILNQLTGAFKDSEGQTRKGADAFAYLRGEIRNSGGALDTLRDQWMKSPMGRLEVTRENVQNLGRALGEAMLPVIIALTKALGSLARGLTWIVDNPIGQVVFGIAGPAAGILVTGIALKALWFGISKIFLNVASNIGLVSVAAGKATLNLKAMATAGAAAAGAGAGAGAAAAGAGTARTVAAGAGRAMTSIPVLGMMWLAAYEISNYLGEGAQKFIKTGEGTWIDQLVAKGAKWHLGKDMADKMDTFYKKQREARKEMELAKQATKEMTKFLQVGSDAWSKMLEGEGAIAQWKPAQIKGGVFARLESRLAGAAARLTGADKQGAESAMAAAATARGLIEKQRKGPLSAVEYKQLTKSLNAMGMAGSILSATYGPSLIGMGLVEKFQEGVIQQAIAAGSPESIEAARRWAHMRGMKYPGRETQIPGTTAHAGGYGDMPGAKLLEDYPWHKKMFPMSAEPKAKLVEALMRKATEEAAKQRATMEKVLERLNQPLQVQAVGPDPLGSGTSPSPG